MKLRHHMWFINANGQILKENRQIYKNLLINRQYETD